MIDRSTTLPAWISRIAVAAAVVAAAVWLWQCWAWFPGQVWNDPRLAPVIGLLRGYPMYPGQTGPASTWMYGPLHLLLMAPAGFASAPLGMLMTAGTLNIALTLGAICLVIGAWPAPRPVPLATRVALVALAVVVWPWATWQFLQSDNTSVALGLVATLALVRARGPRGLWLAAIVAAAVPLGKQTALAVPLAHVVWLATTRGRGAAGAHLLRLVAAGGAWGIILLAGHDFSALWTNLIVTPGSLPWTDEPARRVLDQTAILAVQLTVPAITWLVLRRRDPAGAQILNLPTIVWAIAWLPGFPGLLTVGGSINSLHGWPLWLPAGLVAITAAVARDPQKASRWTVAISGMTLLIGGLRLHGDQQFLLRPEPRIYAEGMALARAHPGEIWFPWNPLISLAAESRRLPDEDGLFVRLLASPPMTPADARREWLPEFRHLGLRVGGSDWGLATSLLPTGFVPHRDGAWIIWSAPAPAAP